MEFGGIGFGATGFVYANVEVLFAVAYLRDHALGYDTVVGTIGSFR